MPGTVEVWVWQDGRIGIVPTRAIRVERGRDGAWFGRVDPRIRAGALYRNQARGFDFAHVELRDHGFVLVWRPAGDDPGLTSTEREAVAAQVISLLTRIHPRWFDPRVLERTPPC